jgi:hypothetical protein
MTFIAVNKVAMHVWFSNGDIVTLFCRKNFSSVTLDCYTVPVWVTITFFLHFTHPILILNFIIYKLFGQRQRQELVPALL